MSPLARAALILGMTAACFGLADGASAQSKSQDAENRRVRVHNQTGATIQTLSAAPTEGGAAVTLLAAPLDPGQSRPLVIDAGDGACVFTLRMTFTDGRTLERPSVNVCRVADVYLTR
jgi:hypothetical protein